MCVCIRERECKRTSYNFCRSEDREYFSILNYYAIKYEKLDNPTFNKNI